MDLQRTRIGGYPPTQTQEQKNTVILMGIAVFFCSTRFIIYLLYAHIFNSIIHRSAAVVNRLRFFMSEKDGM